MVTLEVFTDSENDFPGGCYRSSARVGRIDPPLGDGIGFEEVVSAFEFHAADNAALPGAVRPPDDGQNGHALGGSSAEFAQHFVVPLPRCAGQIGDLKSPAVWLFHNF